MVEYILILLIKFFFLPRQKSTMPFPHIAKVITPLRLIQKLRNVIDNLLVENRKLANENRQLKLKLLYVSEKLSREAEKHSRATAIIDDLILQLEERDQWIGNQAVETASSDELIRNIYVMLQESGKCDF